MKRKKEKRETRGAFRARVRRQMRGITELELNALELAERTVWELRKKLGLEDWRFLGVQIVGSEGMDLGEGPCDAVLTRDAVARTFGIKIRRSVIHEVRLAVVEFDIAHEMAHLCLADVKDIWEKAINSLGGSARGVWSTLWEKEEERAVNRLAGALVGPISYKVAKVFLRE